jgi:hypothetical protein
MAQQFTASIYGFDNGYNSYDWNATMGITRSFPSQGVTIEQMTQPTAYSGVTCNSIITVLPDGLNVKGVKYYTPTAIATLVTAANA